MIVDSLERINRHQSLLEGIAAVSEFLRTHRLEALPAGRHPVSGDDLWVGISDDQGRGLEGAVLEAHRRFADVQVALGPGERIGWKPLARCCTIKTAYDAKRDLEFFADPPDLWFDLPPGVFALFLPEDAHAPLAGVGPVRKAVFKIRIS